MTAIAEPERTGPVARWQRLGRTPRIVLSVLALVIGVNIVLSAISGLVGGQPGGPTSSSFSTGSSGVQGWSDLLARSGHRVDRHRGSLIDLVLDPHSTVVVVDPDQMARADQERLRSFVRAGGRLVLVGPTTVPVIATVTGTFPPEAVSADTVHPWLPVPETVGVRRVVGGSTGWQAEDPSLLPVAGDDHGTATVLVGDVGPGRVVLVADATVFWNRNLDQADNAQLGLDVVGTARRPVLFAESIHESTPTGLAALPPTWRWTAGALVVAVVAGIWSAVSRFGSPEPQRRGLRPPRQDHIDAVAADLDRTMRSESEAVEPLLHSTWVALAARVGAPADASPIVLVQAAEAAGFDPADLAALVRPVAPDDLDHALAVGAIAAARQRADLGLASSDLPSLDPVPGGTHP